MPCIEGKHSLDILPTALNFTKTFHDLAAGRAKSNIFGVESPKL